MKKIIKYGSLLIQSSPVGFLSSCFLASCNLLFAAGLYAMASFIISLAALHPSYDSMMIPVVAVRMFGVGRAVLSYAERYCSHDSTFRILKNLRLKLYDKMLPILPDYETRRADHLSSLISEIELLQEGILRLVYPFVSSLLLLVTGAGIAWLIHPTLTVLYVILFVTNAYLVPMLFFVSSSTKKEQIDYDKHELYEELLELKEGIHEITSDGKEKEWHNRIEKQLMNMNGSVTVLQSAVAFCEALIVFLQGSSLLLILVAASYLVNRNEVSGIYLAATTLALSTMVTEIILPGQTYFKFRGLQRAADTVFGEEQIADSGSVRKENQSVRDGDSLYLKGISWNYPNANKLIDQLTMEVKKGSIVAVTGESGAGKSTLINLILGFLKPQEGDILIGALNLREMDETERLKLFSVVDQKPFFFHQTIYENLRLADPEANEEQMMEVLKKVSLDQLMEKSKKGLHTELYEWGANLSGGELQRLAIARALLKKAPFYIFDEPTAGLDTINERNIMNLILELSSNHGIILITHRPIMLEVFRSSLPAAIGYLAVPISGFTDDQSNK